MTISFAPRQIAENIDAGLDKLESALPTIPAKVLHLQRAAAREWTTRTTQFWTSVGDSAKTVIDVARVSGKTVTGQTRAAVSDVAEVTRHQAATVRGQAAAQGRRVARATEQAATEVLDETIDEIEDTLDEAIDAVEETTPGSGRPYERWTKAELLERAKELDIDGRYKMSKPQLIAALRA